MDKPDPLLSDLCSICHINTPKYRCPRCSTRTCSLPCSRRHKLWSQCSGVRDPAAYLRRSELATESAFDRDFNFITGIERSFDRAERETENRGIELARGVSIDDAGLDGAGPNAEELGTGRKRKHPHQGLVKGEAGFLRGAAAAGVRVIRAPRGMSRNKQNNSRWHPKHKCLSWTVEWIAADGAITARNCLETYSVAEAYDRAFPLPRKEKSELSRFNDEEQTDQKEGDILSHKKNDDLPSSDTTTSVKIAGTTPTNHQFLQAVEAPAEKAEGEQSSLDQTIPPHRDLYFYLHRPRTTSKQPVLAPLAPSESLSTALRSRIVLEYPTIYVLPESATTLLAEKETSPFLLEEEYLRTATPEVTGADSSGLVGGHTGREGEDAFGNEVRTGSSAVDLGNVDENRVMEVLKQDLFESVPETGSAL